MMMMMINSDTLEGILDFYERQFRDWQEVKQRYDDLGHTERRTVSLPGCDIPIIVQHNPARIVSTGASVKSKDIAARPCFLCKDNRPEQQIVGNVLEGWDILINPFPILPVHFTIASSEHTPQDTTPLAAVDFVIQFPGLVAFFNGAKAGASAPDHLHFQGVLASELPILKYIESRHPSSSPGCMPIDTLHVPVWSFVINPEQSGMAVLNAVTGMYGVDSETGNPDPGLVNTFIWLDSAGVLRALVIPRAKHRPDCYYADDDNQLMVSPGALDMAGMIIVPRKEDFEKITAEDIAEIYRQCGVDKETLHRLTSYFLSPQ